jgi:hypothetical protein
MCFLSEPLVAGKDRYRLEIKTGLVPQRKKNRPGADEYILGLGLTLRFQLAHVRARP